MNDMPKLHMNDAALASCAEMVRSTLPEIGRR